jgi:hypothetical protein
MVEKAALTETALSTDIDAARKLFNLQAIDLLFEKEQKYFKYDLSAVHLPHPDFHISLSTLSTSPPDSGWMANVEKEISDQVSLTNTQKLLFDGAGVVAGLGVASLISSLGESGNPWLKGAGLVSGYIMGGMVNNALNGRDALSTTGYIRNFYAGSGALIAQQLWKSAEKSLAEKLLSSGFGEDPGLYGAYNYSGAPVLPSMGLFK